MPSRRRSQRRESKRPVAALAPGRVRQVPLQELPQADAVTSLAELAGSGRGPGLALGGVAIAALVLYVRTLAPSVVGGDSGELIAAAHVLGVPHPPGYPTFAILSHAFGLLPLGEPALGMNLLSAILDSLAVAVIALGILLLARQERAPSSKGERAAIVVGAILGAGLLATSTAFWTYSLVTEVFALNNVLAAGIIVAMLAWARRPTGVRPLWTAALLSGIALTNQQTITLLAPGLFVLYLAGLRRARSSAEPRLAGGSFLVRVGLVPVALLAIGLLPYAYLPIAATGDPAVNWGDPRTLDRFISVVMRESYGTFSLTVRDTRGGILDQFVFLGSYLWTGFTPIGLALAGLGGWRLARRDTWAFAGLLTMFVVSGPLFVAFANPPLDDPVTRGVLERFYILPGLPLAIAIGCGAVVAGRMVVNRLGSRPGAPVAVPVLTWVLLAAIVLMRLPSVDQRDNRVVEGYGRDILETLEPNALLLTRSDENYTAVLYSQVVAGIRPDVAAVDVELLKLPTYVAQIRREHPDLALPFEAYDDGERTSLNDLVRANLSTRPVFAIGRFKEDLSERFGEVPWGLARRVVEPDTAPDPLADTAALARFRALRPPAATWPATTWEGAITANYGSAAFELALDRHRPGRFDGASDVAGLYRTAIRLAPALGSAYKNLGLLLLDNGGSPAEVVAVWRRYLELEPDDPQASSIRAEIQRLDPGG